MRMKCRDRWTELVDFAEGKPSAELVVHLESCPECAKEVERLRRAFRAAELPVEEVPADVVARAKAIMPEKKRRFQLVRSSLQLSSARAVSQAFQAIYRYEDDEIRVAYNQIESGWEIVSQLPPSATGVRAGGKALETDADGRFYFFARTLADAGFTVVGKDGLAEVPSPDEASRGLD